jgi:hypothetical protein
MRSDKLRAVVAIAALSIWGGGSFVLTGDAAPQSAAPQGAPTFSRDVAPIFYDKCVGCHRPG